jgi:8-oxo-dGTP diphosphatase
MTGPGPYPEPVADEAFPARLPRRAAARAFLLDEAGRVLLLRHDDPIEEQHWCGPGGGIEVGETPRQALVRELGEEIVLDVVPALSPCGIWRHSFVYKGRRVVQTETLFTGRVPAASAAAVTIGPLAAPDGIGAVRWWAATELRAVAEPGGVWPPDLAGRLASLR